MAQNITIQGLDGVTNANLDLATPVPIQRTNVDKFESVELNQIKNQIYARCETAGATADKVAYLENFPKCKVNKGLCITVIFDNANTADNISLKLQDKDKNDISGFINIMAMNSNLLQLGAGSIPANSRVTLEYDGTYWLAHTDIVKSSASSVTHADGTVSYTPISSLDESSPAPINSAAIGNDLLRTSDVVSTITEGSASPISSGAVATIAPISSVDDTKNNSVNSTAVKAYAQPKLTAGSNISIENNTISCDVSTMNFKGAVDTYEDLPTTNIDIGDVYNITSTNDTYCWNGTEWVGIGTSVDLSGYVSSNENNSKLWKGTKAEFDAIETKDSATTYIVKDEATEEIALLSADMVEDTVSGNADKIPNSLAISKFVLKEKLYSGGYTGGVINLSKDLYNYDFIILVGGFSDGTYTSTNIFPTEDLIATKSVIGVNNDSSYVWYKVTSGTVLTNYQGSGNYLIKSVYGIKFGI